MEYQFLLEGLGPAILGLLAFWTLPWKGWALWKAARRSEKWWFIAILILNTVAVLDILYIFVFSRKPPKTKEVIAEAPKIPDVKPSELTPPSESAKSEAEGEKKE